MSERMKKANKLVGQYQRLTGAVLSDLLQIVSEAEQEIERLRAEVADARECAKSMFPFTQFHNEPYRSEWLEGFPWLNEKTNP